MTGEGKVNWRHRNGPLPKVYSSENTATRDGDSLLNVSHIDFRVLPPTTNNSLSGLSMSLCPILDPQGSTGSLVDQSEMTLVKSSSTVWFGAGQKVGSKPKSLLIPELSCCSSGSTPFMLTTRGLHFQWRLHSTSTGLLEPLMEATGASSPECGIITATQGQCRHSRKGAKNHAHIL